MSIDAIKEFLDQSVDINLCRCPSHMFQVLHSQHAFQPQSQIQKAHLQEPQNQGCLIQSLILSISGWRHPSSQISEARGESQNPESGLIQCLIPSVPKAPHFSLGMKLEAVQSKRGIVMADAASFPHCSSGPSKKLKRYR